MRETCVSCKWFIAVGEEANDCPHCNMPLHLQCEAAHIKRHEYDLASPDDALGEDML